MRKILILLLIIIAILSSCISKQSPLVIYEYIEGMPLVLEFERPVISVDIYEGNNLVYSYNGDIIYQLKTNYIFHTDITVKITEFNNKTYTNVIRKVEPKIHFLLYGGADNSLDQKFDDPLTNEYDYFFDLDIIEIKNSIQKSSQNILVTVLGDRKAKDDELIFIANLNGKYMEYRYKPYEFNFDLEITSASTDTLFEFLDKMFVKNKNTIKVLDIWDHGNGWAWESKGLLSTKAIVQDDTNKSYLKIKDIRDVIDAYNNKYNTKIDVLAFDACNMTSLEIMYEFKDLVDYFIGSVYTVAGFGFYYDFFHDLNENNLVESFVYNVIKAYNYYYTNISYLDRLTLVGFKLNEFNWNNIEKINDLKEDYVLYKNDGRLYESEPTDMIDVNDLVLNTNEYLSSYINPAIVNAIVRIDGVNYPYSGIGIMFEDIFKDTNNNYLDYKALSFYNDFQDWIENIWKNIIIGNN
ncbi:clostripain-related cysteine peptidase [Marinitoga sp. 38H-ov]|uniref:clostripain-related cysteine peptidase n=1 Tax=Marinitoga sp. 38H-ov TaxID=1755814 RepID=UPI0013EB4846|nr:clostripain-related cysteine peptidase [Marinitoga sp. 38H-ov]KAF2956155.1 hypothetical protein AS160_07240 [Marinitoga sp. 38H-ov]